MGRSKKLVEQMIAKGITDINEIAKQVGISTTRAYELRKELGYSADDLLTKPVSVAQTTAVNETPMVTPVPQQTIAITNTIPNNMLGFVPQHNGYIPRKLYGKKTDIEIMEAIYNERTPLLIIGETGVGKTASVRHFTFTKQLPYMRVNFNGAMTPEDLIGQYVPCENGFAWVDGVLTKFVRNGGVFVVDEINSGNAEILFFLHPLLDDERKLVLVQKDGEVIHAHKDFWLVATMNRDYEGTKPLNLALQDRFKIIEFDYDSAVEKKLIADKFLLELAEKLRASHKKGELDTPISTRGLIYFEQDIKTFGRETAEQLFLNKFNPFERKAIVEVIDLMKTKEKLEAGGTADKDMKLKKEQQKLSGGAITITPKQWTSAISGALSGKKP